MGGGIASSRQCPSLAVTTIVAIAWAFNMFVSAATSSPAATASSDTTWSIIVGLGDANPGSASGTPKAVSTLAAAVAAQDRGSDDAKVSQRSDGENAFLSFLDLMISVAVGVAGGRLLGLAIALLWYWRALGAVQHDEEAPVSARPARPRSQRSSEGDQQAWPPSGVPSVLPRAGVVTPTVPVRTAALREEVEMVARNPGLAIHGGGGGDSSSGSSDGEVSRLAAAR